MGIDFNSSTIIRKNKDYNDVQSAQLFYEKKRMTELATSLFPEDEYPEEFKETLIGLMKFQNPVQMQVWHNKNVIIRDDSKGGELICTTWDNFCTFKRKFACAEMYQALEILKRATPIELFDSEDAKIIETYKFENKNPDTFILEYFNSIAYPKIEKIVNHIQIVLDEIEEQLCKPIRAKINSDLKIMMKLPLTDTVEFIKGKQRKM